MDKTTTNSIKEELYDNGLLALLMDSLFDPSDDELLKGSQSIDQIDNSNSADELFKDFPEIQQSQKKQKINNTLSIKIENDSYSGPTEDILSTSTISEETPVNTHYTFFKDIIDTFNDGDLAHLREILNQMCEKDASIVLSKYSKKLKSASSETKEYDGRVIIYRRIGVDAIFSFWERLSDSVPDLFFLIHHTTHSGSISLGESVIKTWFSFNGTKILKNGLNIDETDHDEAVVGKPLQTTQQFSGDSMTFTCISPRNKISEIEFVIENVKLSAALSMQQYVECGI